jgi:uncharacterized protein YbjQ (UPF0145 family)
MYVELITLAITVCLLLVGLTAGQITEVLHFADLKRREHETQGVILTNLEKVVFDRPILESRMVTGHVVISTDYFKSVCASLRSLVGGKVRSYEKLLDRGRREAALRLKQKAIAFGADVVLNIRYETMAVARSRQGSGVTGVEILAYGTAVRS